MWMENEEDFDRQVEEELQEQEFLDRCFQEMLDEEDQEWFIPSRDLPQRVGQLQQQLNGLCVADGRGPEDVVVGGCHTAALGERGGGGRCPLGFCLRWSCPRSRIGSWSTVGQPIHQPLANSWPTHSSTIGRSIQQPLVNSWPTHSLTVDQPLANPFINRWSTVGQSTDQPLVNHWPTIHQYLVNYWPIH
uniref:Poly(A) binding protein interacting protein 2B n=1 Tax=Meleagris gallopavo TaxID=9103 RepID=A0A803Y254_MELGA